MAELSYISQKGDESGFSVINKAVPPGWYKVVIVKSEEKKTKAGDGKYLELTYETQDVNKSTIIDKLNLINPSTKAQEIGRGAWRKIINACGVQGEVKRSEPVHGRPFEVRVEVKKNPDKNDPNKVYENNECKDYRAVGSGNTPETADPAPETAQPKTQKAW